MTLENQQRNQPKNQQQQRPESLIRQIARLKSQIEQGLSQHSYSGFEVRRNYSVAGRRLALTVLPQPALSIAPGLDSSVTAIPWALNISADGSADNAEQKDSQVEHTQGPAAQPQGAQRLIATRQHAQACAQAGIGECWFLDVANVELRIYRELSATGYQQKQLVHEGETVSPLAFPQLRLTVQEPLPLFFLTRTTTGQKSYPATLLPLRVSSLHSPL